MSDKSRSRVTVTLGRSGRVVKRAGGVSDDGFSNGVSMAGSKRSMRDRLGGDSDDRNLQYKRQRGESFGSSSLNDMHLDRNDLRFKLMQKNMAQQSRNNDSWGNVDLRDKLSSRSARLPVDSKTMRPPEATVRTRYPVIDPRDARLTRQPVLEPRDPGILGRVPPSRNASDLPVMDPGRSYSSWTLDNLRRRTPERLVRPSAPRGLSPDRSREELQRRSSIRTYDDGRSSSCVRLSPSRPVSSTFLTKSSLPAAPVKSVAPLPARYPPSSGILQKMPSMGEEHLSVDSLLHSLGLEKYAIFFKAEEVDMNALRQLGDHDLKELGIPMGPRKKILQALMSRSRRPL